LGTQDTERRQTKEKNTRQQRKQRRWATTIPTKIGGEPRCSWRVSV